MPHEVRIHFKTVKAPPLSIAVMMGAAQECYSQIDVNIVDFSRERLVLPNLQEVVIDSCDQLSAAPLSDDHASLYRNRNGVPSTDVAIYFVQSVFLRFNGNNFPISGCAQHPAGSPGAVISESGATNENQKYVLAHELLHVLGNHGHVDNLLPHLRVRRLRHGIPEQITLHPPRITPTEAGRVINSNLSHPIN